MWGSKLFEKLKGPKTYLSGEGEAWWDAREERVAKMKAERARLDSELGKPTKASQQAPRTTRAPEPVRAPAGGGAGKAGAQAGAAPWAGEAAARYGEAARYAGPAGKAGAQAGAQAGAAAATGRIPTGKPLGKKPQGMVGPWATRTLGSVGKWTARTSAKASRKLGGVARSNFTAGAARQTATWQGAKLGQRTMQTVSRFASRNPVVAGALTLAAGAMGTNWAYKKFIR